MPRFNPNLLVLDTGEVIDATELDPGALRDLGRRQEEARAQYYYKKPHEYLHWLVWNRGDPFGGYFGLLQAKENAANLAGRSLRFHPSGFGFAKALDVPTGQSYNLGAGELPPGFRDRPSAALANRQYLSTTQRGFYTPEEVEGAGGTDALTRARQRALESLRRFSS